MKANQLTNIRDYWDNAVEKFPRKIAAIFEGKECTYAELDGLTKSAASNLQRRFGVQHGQTVAVAMPNCIEFFIAYWAIVRLGAVVVPVNIRLMPAEMARIIGNSDASVLLMHASLKGAVMKAVGSCPNIKSVVCAGGSCEGAAPFEELLEEAGAPASEPEINPDDMIIIMHTSGTTGEPKGAVMTHGDIIFNVKNSIIAHSMRHEDVHLLVVPMFHCTALYSMLPGSAYLGSTIVIAPRSDIRELLTLIERHRITTFIGVPTLFHFLVSFRELDKFDLSSLKMISYAGSVMPPRTIRKLRERFPHVELRNFFGLTETTSVTHVLPGPDALERPDSVGKILPEVWMKIVDEQGREVRTGEVGELCFARENVVRTYWKRPDLMRDALFRDEDGREWFRTGDYALVDEDGYLYLRGRKKEMIIVGGENVYALEVENVLVAHEKVREAAVVGVPATGVRAYLGELIKAVIVPEEGAELTEREIKQYCAERLASYKVPHIIEFRESLPRNPAGKVLKSELVT